MIRTPGATIAVAAILWTSAAAQNAPPQPIETISVDDAVRLALERNLDIAAERLNVQVADTAIQTAALRPNPVFTASISRPESVLVDAGVSPDEAIFRGDYVFEGGGKRQRRMDQATLAKSVVDLQVKNTTRQLVLDVERAFVDVQAAKANVDLAQDTLKAFNDIVAVNVERVRAGDLAQVELSRSRLAAMEFENDVREQESKLRVARNHLSLLIGRGPDGSRLDTGGEFRRAAADVDYATLLQQSLAARPDLQALKADQARSAADIRLQIANGRIDYTVSGEYHRQSSYNVSGNEFLFAVSVPVPIYNRNQGEVARARVQETQAAARIQALENGITDEVSSAYADYTLARDTLANIESRMLADARAVRTATDYSYRRGEASLIELLDAQRAFDDTMRSYTDARAQFARSAYALDALTNGGIHFGGITQ
jgi:cobalt-zinc-cadmium efflux system outer membrane protein